MEGSEEELGERGLAEGDVEELANRRGGSHGRRRGRSIASAYGVQEQRGGQAEGNRRRARRRRGVGEAASL